MEALRFDVPPIAEQAAQWLHRLHSPDVREYEKKAFVEWLRTSPDHIREVLIALSLEDMLQRQARSGLLALAQKEDVLYSIVDFAELPASEQSRRPLQRRRIVAGFAALLASAVLLWTTLHWFVPDVTFETGASEWRTLALSDRSSITLGPRSRVEIKFTNQARDVRLTAGEVCFEVAEDAARPFSVNTDAGTVRALGTRFAVARQDGRVLVTVSRGSVVVTRQSPPHSITLSADEQVAVSGSSDLVPRSVDASRELAWVERRLIFVGGTTLGQAVDAFNRLNRLQLRVENRSLAALPIRGTFAAEDPRSFAEMIERSSNASLKLERGVLRILPRRPDPGTSAGERSDP